MIVGILAPLVNDKLGALVAEPPAVLPKVNVLVISAAALNPPVPVLLKLVAFGILIFVAPAVVVPNMILLEPNDIARLLVLSEVTVPIVTSLSPKSTVPLVTIS